MINGTDILLLVNTGTDESPSYEAVGSQRDATIDRNTAEIDASNKNDGADQIVAAGRRTSSISLDALYVPDDAAYEALRAAQDAGELILIAKEVEGVVTETAEALITAMSESYPDQAEATIGISLTVSGGWTEVGT
jgi:TP901-1 family phage major tail protein